MDDLSAAILMTYADGMGPGDLEGGRLRQGCEERHQRLISTLLTPNLPIDGTDGPDYRRSC